MKRAFDFILSLVLLIIAMPLMIFISILLIVFIGWPVFFCQKRPGLYGKSFTIYKFRTMTAEKDGNGCYLNDEQRMTRLGGFLRRFSLDEFPQLINVLLGDVSLVGPRPLLMEYLNLYSPTQAKRHDVRPGITGWAQINGRNLLSWEERFEMDVWYVENQSFWLDIKILVLTILNVIRGNGVSQEGHVTMEKFKGQ